jgi:hypothetical protein
VIGQDKLTILRRQSSNHVQIGLYGVSTIQSGSLEIQDTYSQTGPSFLDATASVNMSQGMLNYSITIVIMCDIFSSYHGNLNFDNFEIQTQTNIKFKQCVGTSLTLWGSWQINGSVAGGSLIYHPSSSTLITISGVLSGVNLNLYGDALLNGVFSNVIVSGTNQ